MQTESINSDARYRARAMSIVAASLAVVVALAAQLGLNDGGWTLIVPILAAAAAARWPTANIVAVAMVATAGVVLMGLDNSNILFASSLAALMLALNHLQSAATQIRRAQLLKRTVSWKSSDGWKAVNS